MAEGTKVAKGKVRRTKFGSAADYIILFLRPRRSLSLDVVTALSAGQSHGPYHSLYIRSRLFEADPSPALRAAPISKGERF